MIVLSLVFVWVFTMVHGHLRIILNKIHKVFKKPNNNVTKNEVLQHELFMRDDQDSMFQSDISIVTRNIKYQILQLYESDDNQTGVYADKIIRLLNKFRMYDDTSEFLDDNPYILDYLFRDST